MLKRIKLYNTYLKDSEKLYESIINTYRYPFDKIVILLNSYEQVLSVIKYIETKYNVKIYDYEYLNYPPRNIDCLILKVESLYELKYNKNHDTKFGDIMFTLSNVREDILNFIDNRTRRGYYNRNDVLNSNELNSIDSLLSRGIKNTFSSIYNKPNENIYESLLNKLSGPSEEEILNNIKNKPGKILEQAVINDDIKLIKKVFENASFISYNDKNNAMWYACQYNRYDIVKLLNNYDIRINMEVAANKGYIDILKLALDKGQRFLETDILKSGINGGQIESVKFIFDNYKIDIIDSLIAIEHIIRLTNEVPKNRYIDDRSPLIPNRIEIFKYIINKFEYSLDKLEDLWKYAQDNGSYTIRNYIIDIIKKKKNR